MQEVEGCADPDHRDFHALFDGRGSLIPLEFLGYERSAPIS
ncbi:MAG TPA: hypothetical protein VHZ81_12615 [Galbitalea sp.]|jgi:hypothetical protein|nr:hypothetical protein [Galbitalea sp.]